MYFFPRLNSIIFFVPSREISQLCFGNISRKISLQLSNSHGMDNPPIVIIYFEALFEEVVKMNEDHS